MPTQGFTLLELLATIALTAILLAVGIPGVGAAIDRQRLDSSISYLTGSLNTARQEAILRNRPVTLAPIDGDWSQGWQMFLDRNNNGRYDSGEQLLRELQPSRIRGIHANGVLAQYVRFNALGETEMLNGGFLAGTFRLCPARSELEGRRVILNRVGRHRVERGQIEAQYCP